MSAETIKVQYLVKISEYKALFLPEKSIKNVICQLKLKQIFVYAGILKIVLRIYKNIIQQNKSVARLEKSI